MLKSQFRRQFCLTRMLAVQEERLSDALWSPFLQWCEFSLQLLAEGVPEAGDNAPEGIQGNVSGLSRGSPNGESRLLLATVPFLRMHRSIFCELPEGSQGCCSTVCFLLCQSSRTCFLFPPSWSHQLLTPQLWAVEGSLWIKRPSLKALCMLPLGFWLAPLCL